jgi:formylglycine-generating enzyme
LQDEFSSTFQLNQNDNIEITLTENIMKRTCLALLIIGLSLSAFSQKNMIIHKHDGTKYYFQLSAVDSLTFRDSLMISVNGGTFTAGSTPVTISSFYIDKYEVTYDLWTEVSTWALTHGYSDLPAGQNGSNPSGTNNPVTKVNWYDVVKWCNARSEKNGLTPVYYTASAQDSVYRTGNLDINIDAVKWTANGYRLPTETEWEFAARGGKRSQDYTYSGSNTVGDVAWYAGNSGYTTHTVGTKTANELGIYDMSGNVFEWCWDWYSSTYPSGATDPKGPSEKQTYRLIRGGSFDINESYCRVDVRLEGHQVDLNSAFGFRCVQN